MWSDKPSATELAHIIAALRQMLPANTAVQSETFHLESTASPEQVGHLLHDEPGFIWLDGEQGRHLLLHRPLAELSSNGEHTKSLDALEAALQAWSHLGSAMLAGWISYEVGGELEPFGAGTDADPLPRLHFGLYDAALIHDENGWSYRGAAPVEAHELLRRGESVTLPKPQLPPAPNRTDSDSAFLNSVARLVDSIHGGDLFQTNLCRHLHLPLSADLVWPLYRRMRALNPAAAGAFLQLGNGRAILSGSPELFLRVRDGIIESRPIKGTRRRGATEAEDRAVQDDLLHSAKDKAELAMVVDVTRNDLSRVCRPGTVAVTEHATLITLPTLHHTFSRVEGHLVRDISPADILKATFPPASITGAPKIAAMAAAFEEERAGRGPCMGAIGWISLDGDMELSVAIRTAFTSDGQVTYLAGCGITAHSDPAEELAESHTKAAAFLAAINAESGPAIAARYKDGADTLQRETQL